MDNFIQSLISLKLGIHLNLCLNLTTFQNNYELSKFKGILSVCITTEH